MEKDKIRERWTEYIQELYNSERDDNFTVEYNEEGAATLAVEVRNALKKMKTRKATGADGVAVEMFSALEDLGVQKLTNILNKIYDTGNIPEDLLKSVFIALPKKPASSEADLQHLLDIVDRESENVRLGLNTKKTVTMVIFKKADTPTCNLKHEELHIGSDLSKILTDPRISMTIRSLKVMNVHLELTCTYYISEVVHGSMRNGNDVAVMASLPPIPATINVTLLHRVGPLSRTRGEPLMYAGWFRIPLAALHNG
ncbi:hypothetical protein CAPTEDRAFT_212104 [Capitella teleta]|uniref:Uncharacterized protein n=1 Tax=Capitella teleta TaxID=283909 RepID=R7V1G0_CAPTE|nr:hypothetical protein CAPTEDRAFT_212104 [Capitella teleta]|eukprot:ELU12394.1 hypothetical protein CAPTEDRAFT_212104 [Capitella teleta]